MTLNTVFLIVNRGERWWCYPLCVQRPPVQLSVASAPPSHSRPPCLGSGAVHSLLRCLSQPELHIDHSLHSPQLPSTEGSDKKTNVYEWNKFVCSSSHITLECMSHLPIYPQPHFYKNMENLKHKMIHPIGLWNCGEHCQGKLCTIRFTKSIPSSGNQNILPPCWLSDIKSSLLLPYSITSPFHLPTLSKFPSSC